MLTNFLKKYHTWRNETKARKLAKQVHLYYCSKSRNRYKIGSYLINLHKGLELIQEIKMDYPTTSIGERLIAENVLVIKGEVLPINNFYIAIKNAKLGIEENKQQEKINWYKAAVERCDAEMIKKGLLEGLSPNFYLDTDTALIIIMRKATPQIIRYSSSIAGTHPGFDDKIVASCVKVLLDAGANPNLKGYLGYAPLHYAVKGHIETVKVLLSGGANINQNSDSGVTPLLMASYGLNEKGYHNATEGYCFDEGGEGKDMEILLFLLENGANLNLDALNWYSNPILRALNIGRLATVRVLAQKAGTNIQRIPKNKAIEVIQKIHPKPPKEELAKLLAFVDKYWA